MQAEDYQLAVISHRRAELFAQKTLAYLTSTDVDLSRLTVFLSDAQDLADYREAMPHLKYVVCPETRDLNDKYNVVHYFYPIGTNVWSMEDDVELLAGDPPGSHTTRPLTDLHSVLVRGFTEIAGGGLWGLTPHADVFRFKDKISYSHKLVVAYAFGFVSTHDPFLAVREGSKTDYERTSLYFIKYGKCVRLDAYGCNPCKNYKTPGGTAADFSYERRQEIEKTASTNLVERFPHLMQFKDKKSTDFQELRLRPCKKSAAYLTRLQRVIDAKSGILNAKMAVHTDERGVFLREV